MARIKWLGVIRLLGLLLVLVYHLFQDYMPGGFVGVDVFFTLSGFLITAMLIDGFGRNGGFGVASFLKRRATRIFPPLVCAILVTLPFSLLISPDFVTGVGKQLAAAAGFVTNYYEMLTGGSYEGRMLPHLFLHTWTLAVEMQFYLIWGVMFALLTRLAKKRFPNDFGRSAVMLGRIVFALSVAMAIAAYAQMQITYGKNTADPSSAYFATHTHGFPFLLGSSAGALFGIRGKTAALKNGRTQGKARGGITAGFFVGVAALSVGAISLLAVKLDFYAEATYRFGFAGVSLLTILLIVCAIKIAETGIRDIREPKPLTVASDLSYCIYLFHWPLFIVFSRRFDGNLPAAVSALVLSVLFSSIVVYIVEPYLTGSSSTENAARTVRSARNKAARVAGRVSALVVLAMAVTLGGMALARAPEISSLENEMIAGYIYQDADAIGDLYLTTQTQGGVSPVASDLQDGAGEASGDVGDSSTDSAAALSKLEREAASNPASGDDAGMAPNADNGQEPAQETDYPAEPGDPSDLTESAAPDAPPTESPQPETSGDAPQEPRQSDAADASPAPPPADVPPESTTSDSPPPTPSPPPQTPGADAGAAHPTDGSEAPAGGSSDTDAAIPAGVTVIGDSVCMGARKNLIATIPDCVVDAEGSRQIWQGYDLLMDLQKQGSLREYVVIALGTNGNKNSLDKIEQIIADISPGHRLVFVTPYDGRATPTWSSYKSAEYIRGLPEKYGFVTVADWAETIKPDAYLLGSDKVHIGGQPTAIDMYTNCIIDALGAAAGKPAKQ